MQDGFDSMFDDGAARVGRRNTRGYSLTGPASITALSRVMRGDVGGAVADGDGMRHLGVNLSLIMPPAYRKFAHAGQVELPFMNTGDFAGAAAYPGGTRFSEGAADGTFVGGRAAEYMSSSGSLMQESLCSAARSGARVPLGAVRLAQSAFDDATLARAANSQQPMPGAAYGAQSFRVYAGKPKGKPADKQQYGRYMARTARVIEPRATAVAARQQGMCNRGGCARRASACDGTAVYSEGAGVGSYAGPAVDWNRWEGMAATASSGDAAPIGDMDGVLSVSAGHRMRSRK